MKITENDRLALIGQRRCSKCGKAKPIGMFTRLRRGYYRPQCKQCWADGSRRAYMQRVEKEDPGRAARLEEARGLRSNGLRRCKVCGNVKKFEDYRGIPHRVRVGGRVEMNLAATCLACEGVDLERVQRARQNKLLEERGERLCKECRKVKSLEEFYKSSTGGWQATCKSCWGRSSPPSPSST